ncbi:MAG: hypothetical protein EBT04_15540, partial [Betaproteobacteria bacterium]|nr:hypothetical protein [Betaproteobacteria bacterium]
MPLPKAPSKPASPFNLTDDVRARPIRGKGAKAGNPVSNDLRAESEGSFQPDLLDPLRTDLDTSVDSNDSPAAATPIPAKPRRGSKSGTGDGTRTGTASASAAEVATEVAAEINAKAGTEAGLEAGATKKSAAQDAQPKSRSGRVRATSLEPGGKTLRPRLFVLDTNVLMHDPTSLFRFEEHDIFLPMVTLEELDNNKKGMTEVARNARQASRSIEGLVGDLSISLSPMRADVPTGASADAAAPLAHLIEEGVRLDKLGNREATGRLRLQTTALASTTLPSSLASTKADNQILGVVHALQERWPNSDVVLVSKDINMRIKARALGLRAEDYFNDQVVEDTDLLYSGVLQ